MENTILVLINISSVLEEIAEAKVIAIHKNCDLKKRIEYMNKHIYLPIKRKITSHREISFSIYNTCSDTGYQLDEVIDDLKSIGLFKQNTDFNH